MQTFLDIPPRISNIGSFQVTRVLPFRKKRSVGPFIFLDHMGPIPLKPSGHFDVLAHPHIGLATITYLFEGTITHHDSLGTVQEIRPGEVNWMTAGKGIVHAEKIQPEHRLAGNFLHGVQIWVALPKELEDTEPSFEHANKEQLPQLKIGAVEITALVGTAWNLTSPIQQPFPSIYAKLVLHEDSEYELASPYSEIGIYPIFGNIEINGEKVVAGHMGVFENTDLLKISAKQGTHILILGGEPLPESREMWWNFVSTSKEKIAQAKEDWKEQRFPKIAGETKFVPLPNF